MSYIILCQSRCHGGMSALIGVVKEALRSVDQAFESAIDISELTLYRNRPDDLLINLSSNNVNHCFHVPKLRSTFLS